MQYWGAVLGCSTGVQYWGAVLGCRVLLTVITVRSKYTTVVRPYHVMVMGVFFGAYCTRLTEVAGLARDEHGSVHGCLELASSVELLENSDGLLAVHGGRHSISVLC